MELDGYQRRRMVCALLTDDERGELKEILEEAADQLQDKDDRKYHRVLSLLELFGYEEIKTKEMMIEGLTMEMDFGMTMELEKYHRSRILTLLMRADELDLLWDILENCDIPFNLGDYLLDLFDPYSFGPGNIDFYTMRPKGLLNGHPKYRRKP